MLSEAKARSFCGAPPVADPSEAPMNRWSPYFLSIVSQTFMSLRDFDLLVYGRKTYQLMVPYWPDIAKSQSETKADIEFAQTFVSKKKIVFSRSLASAEDENTRIVRTNLRDEILKLKQEQGKNILVGGVDVPSQLMELGLIDEYRFV